MKMNKKLFVGLIAMILVLGIAPIVSAQSMEYYISTGRLVLPDGSVITDCYSGVPAYRNNPDATNRRFEGPIPTGTYYVVDVDNSITVNTIVLRDDGSNNMRGRDPDSFRIHGDNSTSTASAGCIIVNASGRQRIIDAHNRARNNGAILTLYVYR